MKSDIVPLLAACVGVVVLAAPSPAATPPPGEGFVGAPAPLGTSDNTGNNRATVQTEGESKPVPPEEEQARFTLAPGFEIELIASENVAQGLGKFVTVDWDQHGNLWTMTALEYPLDGNENPAAARELYASHARDKVLVYHRDPTSPTGYAREPRVFADGLAIPLGILPYKNGVYVQHGTEIAFLSDTNGDGKADKKEVILSGFGVQDSHLFPHQFTRAPGNWIWMAQGAFNYGKVKTTTGREQQFDQTRMAKFRADGSDFAITSQGPCNIWGLVLTTEGEAWIQEANDYGYPTMPFQEYANYPGCSDSQFKSYAPEFPGTAPDFQMGGTGLSGLALTDKSTWPKPYADVMYVANPITRKIQALKIHRDGPRYHLQKLPDFIQSSDEMFRPVALRLGPDGCLYLVDWYNKIISHNEVPRNFPGRDKTRGRIWRVKCQGQPPLAVPDFTKLSGDELLAKLGGPNTTQSHLAWQAIADRSLRELGPRLKSIAGDKSQSVGRRIAALWALEGLHQVDVATLKPLLGDPSRNLRREAIRAHRDNGLPLAASVESFGALVNDVDPEVRAEIIRTTGTLLSQYLTTNAASLDSPATLDAVKLLVESARAPLAEPTMRSTQNGRTIKAGVAYEREFERYLTRRELEMHPAVVARFLATDEAKSLPVENRLVATLALDPKVSAAQVAELLPQLTRPPGQEEVLRLAQYLEEPGIRNSLVAALQNPSSRVGILKTLQEVRNRLDTSAIAPLVTPPARELLAGDPDSVMLGLELASAFQLSALEGELTAILKQGWEQAVAAGNGNGGTRVLAPPAGSALRALREMHGGETDLFVMIAKSATAPATRNEAIAALAVSKDQRAALFLLELWPNLSGDQRKAVLNHLTGTKSGAHAVMLALKAGTIGRSELDGPAFEKLQIVLRDDAELRALLGDMASLFQPCLRLNGANDAWVNTDLTLAGPFTVEAWVKLDPGIDNNDGILGAEGTLDMNFAGELFRVYMGHDLGDVIIAKKKISPDVWTHLAVTRDASGRFCIFQNGELDTAESKIAPQKFEHCRIGWTIPGKGTAGWLNEFRVWNRARTPEEIRRDFDRSYAGEQTSGLVHYFSGTQWGLCQAGAHIEKTQDFPPLLTAAQSRALAERFSHYQELAEKSGDIGKGKALFVAACQVCHRVAGQGAQIGPVLDGAGALGVLPLLRNLLTPSAAMEPGYRLFRIELKDGEVVEGLRVSADDDAILLRRPNSQDLRVPQRDVVQSSFTKTSIMPEGLLDGLKPDEVSDLFAYLKTLR